MNKVFFILSLMIISQVFGQYRNMKTDSWDTPATVADWEKANPDEHKINPTTVAAGVVTAGAIAAVTAIAIKSEEKKANYQALKNMAIPNGYAVLQEYDSATGKKLPTPEQIICCEPGFKRIVYSINNVECSSNWTTEQTDTPNPAACAYRIQQNEKADKKVIF